MTTTGSGPRLAAPGLREPCHPVTLGANLNSLERCALRDVEHYASHAGNSPNDHHRGACDDPLRNGRALSLTTSRLMGVFQARDPGADDFSVGAPSNGHDDDESAERDGAGS